MSFTTISVIGLGYIGLPTAAAFASRQKQVVGVDINARAVETINRGEIHIVEPDLDRVVKRRLRGLPARQHDAGGSGCLPDCRAHAV
jgi:UDP-N-acetyl-D-mannosaminuronic acid dehydrogenase